MPAEYFEARERALLGERYELLYAAPQETAARGVTVSALRTTPEEFAARADFPLRPSPFCKAAFVVERPEFRPGRHPYHHAGVFYSQEPSASSAAPLLGVRPGMRVLDLCAAPGGKSSQLAAALRGQGLLVSNEYVAARAEILKSNLERMGVPNAVVLNETPARIPAALPEFFDRVLVDAPCSGEGMFRKDPVAVEEWSPENVEICWQRQRRIIADVWPSLKPGGILIYSTCTYNTKEDEENVRWIQQEFGAESLAVDIREEWNITGNLLCGESASVYHFFPHKTKGEGFFLSVLRKPETAGEDSYADYYSFPKGKSAGKKGKKGGGASSSPVSKENMATAGKWLNDECAGKYVLSAEGAEIHAFPQQCVAELAAMKQHLRVVQAGVSVGEVKGKDLIPAHALAMSALLLRQDVFATEAVSYEQAIAYLRKEAVTLPATAPRGYVLLTYRNIPLGFVKNIGNRANNLYPQEWRIRSGYLPEKIRVL